MARIGKRVKTANGTVAYVEEHEHAYLVRGYGIKWGITIAEARLALFEYLGRKKWTKIARMPARPFYTRGLDKNPTGAVALYFAIGPGAPKEYKP